MTANPGFHFMSETANASSPQAPAVARTSKRAAGERILDQASAIFRRAGFKDASFLLHWPAIAGPHIARVAQPVKWQESPNGAVVTLRCEPGAAVLLQHETRTLVEKANAYLGTGRIARFKFVSGPLPGALAVAQHPAPDTVPPPKKLDLNQALERLSRLRSRLTRS
jgi:hypothetical protein